MQTPPIEQEVSNILLGGHSPSDRFTIKNGWFTFHLKIKYLTARQIILVSRELIKIKTERSTDETMFQALMESTGDLNVISRAIALSTGVWYWRIVAKAILKLQVSDIQTLFSIVIKKSDAERFFFIIASARKLNLMKK